jgi:SpoVK/Ycf46/Vps4 family AAA+-type ATPase
MTKLYYKNSRQHIYDELLLVDVLIHAQVIKFRQENKTPQNTLKGLYISEEEIDAILEKNKNTGDWVKKIPDIGTHYEKLTDIIRKLSADIRIKVENSIKQGISLKLIQLAELYQLTSFEINIFCICLAPQFDSKYSKLFAYLQNDVTRKNPSVELLLNLLCRSFEEKVKARQYFYFQSTLFKNNILEFIEDPHQPHKSHIMTEIKINRRILGYILENYFLDDDISLVSTLHISDMRLSDMNIPGNIKEKLQNFVSYYKTVPNPGNFIFSFYGAYGSQKQEVSSALCNELGVSLLVVDLLALHNADIYFERGMDLLLRESNLIPAALFFKNSDFIFSGDERDPYIKRYFLKEIDNNVKLAFISSMDMLPIHGEFLKQKLISLQFPVPDYPYRKKLWEYYLKNYLLDTDIDMKEIAGKYNLTGGQIRDIVSTAGAFALWRSPDNTRITQDDLQQACHLHSNQKLNNLAQRIKPKHGWDDIILIAQSKAKLKELVDMFKYKHTVYDEWGFNQKLSLGKGISALFYGEPGTGKTLACEIVAFELGMELYKIDISTVVSKYVGETEKNLKRIFSEAECSNAILFFDEADALFGKRTEVKDAHDRYANIEVSYLLQQIDEYNGIVIMATNLSQNIDRAFERRLHFSINFPFPEEKLRLLIWKNIFPQTTPIENNIDFSFLAKKFDISGGHIKNIALTAAFYAAKESKPISMNYIIKACKTEYEKMGRLWNDADFLYKKK